ncbi:BCCT family transporter [Virgibacillus sp. SK37]|uniref:glycine betaine uptake BCCT transporter n=1 Tax=Virgibacillus sp. SK37 TaxID=403957 RepID=UPI0004D1104E|nr:BCCT family transporter [Virgibacillus sp. SK37]AIF44303.1 glycine/betaine ABC transporter permease [Virgibacillus sp. SK37]
MKRATSVFYISASIITVMVILGAIMPDAFQAMTTNIKSFIATSFGWYYLIIVTAITLVCMFLLISPIGKIKLGKPDEKPEFSRPTWIAMLFSAGMGIGLVFYGSAEPLSHYALSSPTGETGTNQAIKDALRFTFFHWGIHAWSIYGIVALVLAYFNFRKDEPGLISATLRPVLGDRVKGATGRVVDIIAVVATVLGVATTLGFGAVQINGGLSFLYDIPVTIGVQFIIIAIVTVLFMISAWSGLGKGIKYLSNANMGLATILLLLIFIFGPTIFILNLFTDTIGTYIQSLPKMSFRIAPLDSEAHQWINDWTLFYWTWWISWSPFVGVFIARVSRGRSIREFILNVLFVPSIVSFFWFAAFGGAAIKVENSGLANISSLATEEVLFGMFEHYPAGLIASIIAMLLVATFFITSADSGTFVLGMMTTNGSHSPSNQIKIVWGVLLSAASVVLLYSGGLQALQNMMIIAALPFSIIMALMIVSLFKSLSDEAKQIEVMKKKKKQ